MTDDNAAGEAPADDKTAEDDIETKARESGWRPKEEWTGKPEHWKSAETWVEHGDQKSRIAKLEDQLSRVGKTTEKAIENLKRAHAKEIEGLKAQRAAIVEKGGKGAIEAVEKIDDKIDELKAETSEKIEAEEDKHEVTAEWQLANSWFESNEDMTKYAVRISQGFNEKNPKASMKENLTYVDKKMRERFPDYDFGKKPTKTAGANGHAPVDGGGVGTGPGLRKGGPTSDDLPTEAKEVGAQLVKQGLYKDMGAYAKEYWKNA
jgi:hypothetical protein